MWYRFLGILTVFSILWLSHSSIQAMRFSAPANKAVLQAETVRFSAEPGIPDPNDVLALVNAEREAKGLHKVKANEELAQVADSRAKDMARNRYYSHKSPSGKYYNNLMEERDMRPSYSCENLGLEFTMNESKYTDSWLKSTAGHRECMLNHAATEAGYAAVRLPPQSFTGISEPTYIVVAIHSTPL